MINVAIIGAGNISNTRHIPAIIKNSDLSITGIITDDPKKSIRTLKQYPFIKNSLLTEGCTDVESLVGVLSNCDWFINDVDAVIIGTPPHMHYCTTKACLLLNKHVLVEKPMMMNIQESEDVCEIAKQKKLILNVMHSFQFASGIQKLSELVENGDLGQIVSILEIQLTNRARRLPVWYNDLPLGLFYDEAAHFFYCAKRFGGGGLKILNAHARYGSHKENTPIFLQVQLTAGEIPVQMFMNFNSPICEWGLLILGEKKIAIYDYFKDILIVLDNDGQHLANNVLRTSCKFFWDFWRGFVKNGFRMITKRLLYGHDNAINAFIHAIQTGISDEYISSGCGYDVVKAMNEVVELVKKENYMQP